MKSYFQLLQSITEAVATKRRKPFDTVAFDAMQQKKYGAVMAKAAADALAAAAKRKAAMKAPARQAFPWVSKSSVPGWWNPDRPWFTFKHSEGGYHVTRIVNDPQKFGISNTELVAAAKKDSAKYKDWGGEVKRDASWVLDQIRTEAIDLSFHIQNLAYSKGWLKVYGGSQSISIEGNNKSSVRAALREIRDAVAGKDIVVEVFFVGISPDKIGKYKYLRSPTEIDAYINSL